VLLAPLARPDQRLLALYLVAPYLPYMRQDAVFAPGQGVTSRHVARLLWVLRLAGDGRSTPAPLPLFIRGVPHPHPRGAGGAGDCGLDYVTRPMLVGPDAESAQWVAQVAAGAGCPYTVLSKVRSGDREVAVSAADAAALHGYTPVLVDDIISTARTMMAAVRQLQAAGLPPPVCIGVHALFAGDAYEALQAAGPARIVTCDTVPHLATASAWARPWPMLSAPFSRWTARATAGWPLSRARCANR
jgi:ribose-phosphate pyrophosphokinase